MDWSPFICLLPSQALSEIQVTGYGRNSSFLIANVTLSLHVHFLSDRIDDMDWLTTSVYFAYCCLVYVNTRDKEMCLLACHKCSPQYAGFITLHGTNVGLQLVEEEPDVISPQPMACCSGIQPGQAWLCSRREGPAISPVNKAQTQSEREAHPVFFRLQHPLSSTSFYSRHLAEVVERGFVHVL